MKIQAKLQFSTIIAFILALIIGFVLFSTSSQVNKANEENHQIVEISAEIEELRRLSYSYFANPSEKEQIKWLSKYGAIEKMLKTEISNKQSQILLNNIRQNHLVLLGIFEKKSNGDPKKSLDELISKIDTVLTSTFRLISISRSEIAAFERKTSSFILIALAIIAILIASTSYLVRKNIVDPIAHLALATENVSKKRLNYRIGLKTNDEIGRLAKAFDAMTRKIQHFYGECQNKVVVRTQELALKVDQLEKAKIKLSKLLKQEKEVEKMKDNFLSFAAHQLRTPLGSIRWNLELLIGKPDEIPKTVMESLQQMYESNLRIITLVNDILNVSCIEDGKCTGNPESTNILKIIQDAINEMLTLAQMKEIKINFNFQDNVPEVILDPVQFRQIIINILSNAIKYNRPNGLVNIDITTVPKFLKISIADTGIGIPKDDQKHLFSKFYRAGNASLKETEGTGLGLFMVKSYVERAGGKVWLESEEGKFTKYFLEFPIK